jgi:hypothetical protein
MMDVNISDVGLWFCGLFYGAVSTSDYTASNNSVIGEL